MYFHVRKPFNWNDIQRCPVRNQFKKSECTGRRPGLEWAKQWQGYCPGVSLKPVLLEASISRSIVIAVFSISINSVSCARRAFRLSCKHGYKAVLPGSIFFLSALSQRQKYVQKCFCNDVVPFNPFLLNILVAGGGIKGGKEIHPSHQKKLQKWMELGHHKSFIYSLF